MMYDKIQALLATADAWQAVGSRVTCNPAPTDTDYDILVCVTAGDSAHYFVQGMKKAGFEVELGEGYAEDALNSEESDRFQSYRYGDINLIVTVDEVFYMRFLAATSVCKRLNLLDKADRIALFQAVLYANTCD